MKKRYTDQQIAYALREVESGVPVAEICRKMGISDATFYNWRKKFAGMGVSEIRRLKALEDENRQLKRLVADLSLDKHMLRMCCQKSFKACKEAQGSLIFVQCIQGKRETHLQADTIYTIKPSI